jgi:hypothetical protein
VTIALDHDAEAARPWVERAQLRLPALVDAEHQLDALLGVVNVPAGVWVDEDGQIVRPPEPAFPWRPPFLDRELPADMDPRLRERLEVAREIRVEWEPYVDALRDWAAHGRESHYALSPDEVLRRSRPRPVEEATAAAHFSLGQHLWQAGERDGAVQHFRAAHRLAPDNWTYRRQAWHLADPMQLPSDLYEGDWLSDVLAIGPERYYAPLQL